MSGELKRREITPWVMTTHPSLLRMDSCPFVVQLHCYGSAAAPFRTRRTRSRSRDSCM